MNMKGTFVFVVGVCWWMVYLQFWVLGGQLELCSQSLDSYYLGSLVGFKSFRLHLPHHICNRSCIFIYLAQPRIGLRMSMAATTDTLEKMMEHKEMCRFNDIDTPLVIHNVCSPLLAWSGVEFTLTETNPINGIYHNQVREVIVNIIYQNIQVLDFNMRDRRPLELLTGEVQLRSLMLKLGGLKNVGRLRFGIVEQNKRLGPTEIELWDFLMRALKMGRMSLR